MTELARLTLEYKKQIETALRELRIMIAEDAALIESNNRLIAALSNQENARFTRG